MIKRRVWHVDLGGALIIAGLMALAYFFDGPVDPRNAIKPVATKTDSWLRCHDGQPPVDYQCPDGDRL